ncbi:hypothetical protein ACLB1R_29900 [Escherichia coli]
MVGHHQYFGSNRTIMQACISADNDVVVVDRNCHKSIEQGLMLTGAKPVYMVPSRNRYGIIGPIYPQEMQPETLQKKISESPLTKDKAGQKPSYCVVTNCTYDGVCYNAKEAQDLLRKTSDRLHFDEAWRGLCTFQPDLCQSLLPCAANTGNTTVLLFSPPTPPTNC